MNDPINVTTLLAKIRGAGWSVAVHNDYRLDGEPMTFWLFTSPDGRWAKGEGSTDVLALLDVAENVVSSKTTISFPKPGDPVWIRTSDGWKQEVVAERPSEQYAHSFRVVGGARELFWADRRSVWLDFNPCDPGKDETVACLTRARDPFEDFTCAPVMSLTEKNALPQSGGGRPDPLATVVGQQPRDLKEALDKSNQVEALRSTQIGTSEEIFASLPTLYATIRRWNKIMGVSTSTIDAAILEAAYADLVGARAVWEQNLKKGAP
jgi:hypothetical protein